MPDTSSFPNLPGMPKAISLVITYDKNLQKIIGKQKEDSMSSEGMTFAQFMMFLFESYPEIPKQYPPGRLGFSVNGAPPQLHDILKDGDLLYFVGTGNDGITRTPFGFNARSPSIDSRIELL
ncbi:hypothetical protein HZA87_02985 [Candidatus Uhrbacteria bacterium]|nr:hypothetical protein [Candidatus Uhrbacteria bacterium]